MKDKTLYRKRMFINPDKHSNAFVNAHVEKWAGLGSQEPDHLSGDITIADCSRVIHLEIDGHTKKRKRDTLKKLDNLIGVLSEVRDVIEAEEV